MNSYYYKIVLAYNGINFCGWQKQPNCRTVQGEFDNALRSIIKNNIKYSYEYISRTDAKVHAFGQLVLLKIEKFWEAFNFKKALNSVLPDDIRVVELVQVNDNFSLKNNIGKLYLYRVGVNKNLKPFWSNYVWNLKSVNLDTDKLLECARFFVGTHDFKAYMGAGSSIKTTTRTIYDFFYIKTKNEIDFWIFGNGFLKNMVRGIVGTCIDYARGWLSKTNIIKSLEIGDRRLIGQTAPGQGLYLVKILFNKTEYEIIKKSINEQNYQDFFSFLYSLIL